MNFLRAKNVRQIKYYYNRSVSIPMDTQNEMEHELYVDVWKCERLRKLELVLDYNGDFKPPQKLSISAIQYVKYPFDIEISLYEGGSIKAYQKVVMQGFDTSLVLSPYTSKISFAILQDDKGIRCGKIRFNVNFVEF